MRGFSSRLQLESVWHVCRALSNSEQQIVCCAQEVLDRLGAL